MKGKKQMVSLEGVQQWPEVTVYISFRGFCKYSIEKGTTREGNLIDCHFRVSPSSFCLFFFLLFSINRYTHSANTTSSYNYIQTLTIRNASSKRTQSNNIAFMTNNNNNTKKNRLIISVLN